MKRKKTRDHTITGVIVPEDWDENDNVIRVAIKTPNYQEYVVEHNKQGKELLSLIDHKVQARGRIRQRLNGDMLIAINSYEQIEEDGEREHVSEGRVD